MHISIFGLVLFVLSLFLELGDNGNVKICNFVHKALESCYNLNISSVGYKHSLLVSHLWLFSKRKIDK